MLPKHVTNKGKMRRGTCVCPKDWAPDVKQLKISKKHLEVNDCMSSIMLFDWKLDYYDPILCDGHVSCELKNILRYAICFRFSLAQVGN